MRRFSKKHPFLYYFLLGLGIGTLFVASTIATIATLGAAAPALGLSLALAISVTGSVTAFASISIAIVATVSLFTGMIGFLKNKFAAAPKTKISIDTYTVPTLPATTPSVTKVLRLPPRPHQTPKKIQIFAPGKYSSDMHVNKTISVHRDRKHNKIPNLPKAISQTDFNCGYYAAAYAISIWNQKDNKNPLYHARRRDVDDNAYSKKMISLKSLGKQAGITGIGGLFDVNLFSNILANTEYQSTVHQFHTAEELFAIIKLSIDKGIAVTMPIDWDANQQDVGCLDGKKAHYITLVGYKEEKGEKIILFKNSSTPGETSLKKLFASNANLNTCPAQDFNKYFSTDDGYTLWSRQAIEDNEYYIKKKAYSMPATDLSGLRNKLVIISPKPVSVIQPLIKHI